MFPAMRARLRKLTRTLLRLTAESVEVDGLWVEAVDDKNLLKVQNALKLIRERDPKRYARLVKDLDRVWVRLLPGPLGQFEFSDWTCELDERFVAGASVEQIASTIVHEATHARLWRRGFRYDEGIRRRVETACFRQEQAFAARLPASEGLAEELAAYLDLPAEYWSDGATRRHALRGLIATARHLNMPRWLVGLALRRRRAARRRYRRAEAAACPAVSAPPAEPETKTAAPRGATV